MQYTCFFINSLYCTPHSARPNTVKRLFASMLANLDGEMFFRFFHPLACGLKDDAKASLDVLLQQDCLKVEKTRSGINFR